MTQATYIKRATLAFPDIWENNLLSKDKGGRWNICEDTPEFVKTFLAGYRSPSRSWPHSYSKALLSQKFAKLLTEYDPDLAIELGVAE